MTAGLGHGADVMATLQDMGVHFSAVDQTAAIRAGEMQRRYNQRAKDRAPPATTRRTIPDFIVGAHALLQCKALITRDAGFFRDYFKGLRIIVPKAS